MYERLTDLLYICAHVLRSEELIYESNLYYVELVQPLVIYQIIKIREAKKIREKISAF